MNCVADFVASLIVDSHVVLLATVLLDLRHDFLFTVAAHLPITVLRPHIGALEIDLAFVLLFRVRNAGNSFCPPERDMLRSLWSRSNTRITLVALKEARLIT